MSYRSTGSKVQKVNNQVEYCPPNSAKAKFFYMGVYAMKQIAASQPVSRSPKKSLDKKSYR